MNKRFKKIPKHAEEIYKIKTDSNFVGLLRLGFLGILILCQVALLVFLSIVASEVFPWYLLISAILSLICAFHALGSNRNSLSKAVWILFVLTFFPVGFFVYFLASNKMFFAKDKRKYKKIFARTSSWIPLSSPNVEENEIGQYLKEVGKFNSYKDTKLKYFYAGSVLFDDVLEELLNAKEYVFIEFFIFSSGMLLDRILAILEPKIKAGLDVRIIYDSFGSHAKLKDEDWIRMKKMGIKIYSFNRLTPVLAFSQNYRDHRKFIIIDGRVAYTGGANLGDEYTNEKRMYGYWKDEGIKVSGKSVDRMVFDFLRHYEFVSGKEEDYQKYMGKYEKFNNDSLVVPYVDGLDYPTPIGKNVYLKMMMRAEKILYIMTPYFVVDDTVYDILRNKAQSGVDVRIILPDVPDKKFVYMVSMANAESLISSGVKIYKLTNCFVHSKVMMNEKEVVMGSINLDLRSFYQQFESAIYTNDKGVRKDVQKDFVSSLRHSLLITKEMTKKHNVFFKIFAALLQVWSPLM